MELAEGSLRAQGYSWGWVDSHRHPGVLLYDLECVCICLGLMVTTGFLLPLAREPISSIPVRGWGHGNQVRGSLFPYLLPQPLVDGQTLKILNLCARICSVPGWGTEVCPYPGPREISSEIGMATAMSKMPQAVCVTPTLPKFMVQPLCRWRVTAVTDKDRVGEAGWDAGKGNRSWRTGLKEVHLRKVGLCRNQMFLPIIPSFYLMDFLFCSCHKESTHTLVLKMCHCWVLDIVKECRWITEKLFAPKENNTGICPSGGSISSNKPCA